MIVFYNHYYYYIIQNYFISLVQKITKIITLT